MSEPQLKQLESEARDSAQQLRALLDEAAPTDLTIDASVIEETANGSNSLDSAFVEWLLAGNHLDENFLAI